MLSKEEGRKAEQGRVTDVSYIMLCEEGDLRGVGEGAAHSASGWMGYHRNICSGLEAHLRVCWMGNTKTDISCRQMEG